MDAIEHLGFPTPPWASLPMLNTAAKLLPKEDELASAEVEDGVDLVHE